MSRWQKTPLGEVVQLDLTPETVRPDKCYPIVGVYGFGRGLFPREAVSGSSISAAQLFQVKSEQFIYSRLKAFEGAFGLVPPELDGRFVSNEFPTFTCDRARLLPAYLGWYFRNPVAWKQAALSSTGIGARRERLKPEQLLKMEIPLPSLSEQQRIVKWIDAVAVRVEEAKQLTEVTDQRMDDLSRSMLWSSSPDQITPTPMSELVRQREPDVEVLPDGSYDFAGVYCFGRGVFRGQTRSGMDFQYPRLTRLRARDFVYPKLMAWEGALAVVPPECDGLVVSTEYPVFEIDESKVLPEVLDVYFRTPSVWPEISGTSTGTNVRRRRLNPKDFLKYKFPLPCMAVQQRIREVRARTEEATRNRQSTREELDAVLKSILNEVFDGKGTSSASVQR